MNAVYTGGATGTVGKKELCAHLKWSRPTLDKRLKVDAKFPVVSRGDQSGGWAFDVAVVDAYLAGTTSPPTPAPPAIDPKQLRDAVAPPLPAMPVRTPSPERRSGESQPEATARARKENADASLKEIKLQEMSGELVSRERMRQISATIIANLAANFDQLASEIVKRQNLPEEMEPAIQAQLDEVRRAWATQSLTSLTAELPADAPTA